MTTQKPKPVDITFVLDETGSMYPTSEQTIAGFNTYVRELRTSETPMRMTLVKFNSTHVETLFADMDVQKVPDLTSHTYTPAALTPLLDAVGNAITNADGKVAKLKKAKKATPRMLVVVLTDGYENASQEYTQEQIASMIKDRQAKDWTFVFMGADQNAWSNSQQYNFNQGNTISYASSNTTEAYAVAAVATRAYAASGRSSTSNFFDPSGTAP